MKKFTYSVLISSFSDIAKTFDNTMRTTNPTSWLSSSRLNTEIVMELFSQSAYSKVVKSQITQKNRQQIGKMFDWEGQWHKLSVLQYLLPPSQNIFLKTICYPMNHRTLNHEKKRMKTFSWNFLFNQNFNISEKLQKNYSAMSRTPLRVLHMQKIFTKLNPYWTK